MSNVCHSVRVCINLRAKFQKNESTFGHDYFFQWNLLSIRGRYMRKIARKIILDKKDLKMWNKKVMS